MKARTRNALAPLALLAALGAAVAFAWFGVEKRGEREEARKQAEDKLFSFEPAKVKEVAVEAKGTTAKLVRDGGGWRIVSPVEAQADRYTVDALVEKVSALRRKQSIAADGADLGRFGLEKPRVKIALTLEGGKAETVALGDENGFDSSVFVRANQGGVEVVGGDAKWALEKDLFDLREKRLLVLEDKDIQRIEVKAPKLSYAVERSGSGWKLAEPIGEKADQTAVDRVLGALRGLRATQFLAASGPDNEHGLDHPRYQVRLVGPGSAERRLAVGAAPQKKGAPEPSTLYARVGEAKEIAAVPASQVKDLDEDLWSLRDKSVLGFDRDKVTALRFEAGGSAIEVQKGKAADGGAESWNLTAPRAAPVKPWKISGLLYGLSSLKATRFADESGKQAAAYGLDHPARVVTLLGADGATLGRLEVGKEEGDKAFVRGDGPRIYEIEKARLSELPKSPEDLEDKPTAENKASGKSG